MRVKLAGDRTLLIGRAVTVLRGELLIWPSRQPRWRLDRCRCQASCAASPSRSETCGAQPSSSRARSIDAAVAERVAGLARLGLDRHRRARELADERDQLVERDLGAAREVQYVPGATSRSAAARLPRTMSAT